MNNKKYIIVVLTVIVASSLIMGGTYAFRQLDRNKSSEKGENLIGGQKDAHGCLIAAGYSWCELKNKCLMTWEEPCLSDEKQIIIEDFLKNNISSLSPTKEVLGGKFYITRIRYGEPGQLTVDYEDGHIALQANVSYCFVDDKVTVNEFKIIDDFGAGATGTKIASEDDVNSIKMAFMDKYNKTADEVQVTVDEFDGNFARGGVKLSMKGQFGEGGIFLAYKEEGIWKLAFDGNGMIPCSDLSQYKFPEEMKRYCYDDEAVEDSDKTQIANPASIYCVEQGGEIIIENRKIGEYGVCLFDDNRQCEEWAMYRGECPVGGLKISGYGNEAEIYCAITGGQVEGVGTASPMCKRIDGTYCNTQVNFDGDCPDPNDPNPNAGNKEVE